MEKPTSYDTISCVIRGDEIGITAVAVQFLTLVLDGESMQAAALLSLFKDKLGPREDMVSAIRSLQAKLQTGMTALNSNLKQAMGDAE